MHWLKSSQSLLPTEYLVLGILKLGSFRGDGPASYRASAFGSSLGVFASAGEARAAIEDRVLLTAESILREEVNDDDADAESKISGN